MNVNERANEARITMDSVSTSYELREPDGGLPIKSWTRGVPVEDDAIAQLSNIARRCSTSGGKGS